MREVLLLLAVDREQEPTCTMRLRLSINETKEIRNKIKDRYIRVIYGFTSICFQSQSAISVGNNFKLEVRSLHNETDCTCCPIFCTQRPSAKKMRTWLEGFGSSTATSFARRLMATHDGQNRLVCSPSALLPNSRRYLFFPMGDEMAFEYYSVNFDSKNSWDITVVSVVFRFIMQMKQLKTLKQRE